VFRAVFPCGVTLFDQADLAGTNPALDLLLTSDGVTNVRKLLEIHEARDAVHARESWDETALVFVDTPCEIVGNAATWYPFLPSFFLT